MLFTPNCTANPDRLYYGDDVPVVPDGLTMSGTITPDDADITFTVGTSDEEGIVPVFKYTGKHWKDSAKLITTGDKPGTEGKLIPPPPPAPGSTREEKFSKTLKLALSAGFGALFLCCLACCCCCLWRKRKARAPVMVVPVGLKESDVLMGPVHQPFQQSYPGVVHPLQHYPADTHGVPPQYHGVNTAYPGWQGQEQHPRY
jgi:hypothetical protein